MSEKPPQPPKLEQEKGPEKHPSEEEVRSLFEKFTKGSEFIEIKKIYDAEGLRDWEIRITNEDGSTAEYLYGRTSESGEPNSLGKVHHRAYTQIEVAHFDKDGFPEGGGLVAEIRDGEWVEVP